MLKVALDIVRPCCMTRNMMFDLGRTRMPSANDSLGARHDSSEDRNRETLMLTYLHLSPQKGKMQQGALDYES